MKIINTDTLKEYEVDTIKLFQKLVDYKYTDYLLKYTISFYPLITCFYINNHTNGPGGEVTVKFNTNVTICDSSFLKYIITDYIDEIILNDEKDIKNNNYSDSIKHNTIDIEDGVFLPTDRVFDSFSDYKTHCYKFFNEFDIGTKVYIKSESKIFTLSSHYNLIDNNECTLNNIKDGDTFIYTDSLNDDIIFQKLDKQPYTYYIPVKTLYAYKETCQLNHIEYFHRDTLVKKIHVMQYAKEHNDEKRFKGLSIEELVKLNKFIDENNSWKSLVKINSPKHKRIIKYYEVKFDTRTNEVCSITFYISGKEPKVFNSSDKNFKTHIYAWLVEDIS